MPRRTFLRGLGATVALPYLDAMVPAGRAPREGRADATRLVCIEEVHGWPGCNDWGASQHLWAPANDRPRLRAQPRRRARVARAVARVPDDRQQHRRAHGRSVRAAGDRRRSLPVERGVPHPVAPEADAGLGHLVGTSIDQLYAAAFGQDTPIPSMQLCIENLDQAGGCDYNYACAYTDTISWASPTEPLPMIRNPRMAFDMLFGAGGKTEDRAERRQATDAASSTGSLARSADVRSELGPTDRRAARPVPRTTSASSSGASRRSKRATPAARRASCRAPRPACRTRSPST